MKTYQIVNCSDSSIPIRADILAMGFEPDSTYCMYFFDHTKDTDDANVLEIVLLPFDWNTLQKLYSITIPLRNVPHATGHASRVLTKAGIDLKTTVAVDSIAGNIGSLQAAIVSDVGLDRIDSIFADNYDATDSQLKEFVPPPSEAKGVFLADRRYLGRFITGRKYTNNLEEFSSKLAECNPSVLGRLVDLKRSGDTLDLAIPPEIIAYLNKKYGRPSATTLGKYDAALSVDTDFNRLSISFLDPNEIRMLISFITEDRRGLFNLITDYLGAKQVNLRIVYNKNIVPGKRMKLEFTADISRTELPLYTVRTMKLLMWSQLRDRLERSEILEKSVIERVEVQAVSGYPRRLPRFSPEDCFDLIDMYFVTRNQRETSVPDSRRLSRHFDKKRDDGAEKLVCLIGQVLDELYTAHKNTPDMDAHIAQEIESALSNKLHTGADKLTVSKTNGHNCLVLKHDQRCYWILILKSGQLCLVFKNTPPYNLHDTFFLEMARRCPGKVTASNFGPLCSVLLENLSYGFPSLAEFERFGTLDAGVFRNTAEKRFANLSADYISEKWIVDKFPIEGNERLASALEAFLRAKYAKPNSSERTNGIRVIDLGAAGGALTTLFVVRTLARLRMLKRAKLTLVDLSADVLDATRKGEFDLPHELQNECLGPVTEDEYKKLLASADPIVADLTELPGGIGTFDVVVSGFAHHHMNNGGRRMASYEMARIVAPGGFVGLVDESLTYDQYIEWRTNHIKDSVAPAQESFLQTVGEHAKYFSDAGMHIKETRQAEHYYMLWGVGAVNDRTLRKSDSDATMKKEGETMPADKTIDWLAALAAAAKGLPGGQIILGPLEKLRDQKQLDEKNAQLHAAIGKNQELTNDVLKAILGIEDELGEARAALCLMGPLLREAVSSQRRKESARTAMATLEGEYPVTEFFIPLEPGLLFEELHTLYPSKQDMGDLRVCLASAGLALPEGDTSDRVILTLLNSMVGKSPRMLAKVFTCLCKLRQDSRILRFAADYLSARASEGV